MVRVYMLLQTRGEIRNFHPLRSLYVQKIVVFLVQCQYIFVFSVSIFLFYQLIFAWSAFERAKSFCKKRKKHCLKIVLITSNTMLLLCGKEKSIFEKVWPLLRKIYSTYIKTAINRFPGLWCPYSLYEFIPTTFQAFSYYWKTCKIFSDEHASKYRLLQILLSLLMFFILLRIQVSPNLFYDALNVGRLIRRCKTANLPIYLLKMF